MANFLDSIGAWAKANPQALQAFGSTASAIGGGMVGHGNDQRDMFRAVSKAMTQDQMNQKSYLTEAEQARATQAQLAAEQEKQNETIQWLQQQGYDDLVSAVGGGFDIGEAWKIGLERANPEMAGGGFGLNPVVLRNEQTGQYQTGQMSQNGGILINGEVLPGIPQGWSLAARPENLDFLNAGNQFLVANPNTGGTAPGPLIQGPPSSNMAVTQGPNGVSMAPVPGSPQAIEQQQAAAGAQARVESLDQRTDLVLGKIDEAIRQADWGTTGWIGAATSVIPGSPSYNLRETVKTVQANIGFSELQQMRENSPTGGALGQVAVQELEMLQKVLGSLDPNQSDEVLTANLQQIAQLLERQRMYRQEAFKQRYGGQQTQLPPQGGSGGWTVLGVE